MRKKTKILDVVVFGVFSFLRFGSAIEVAWAGNRVRDFSAKIGNLFLPTTKKRKLSRDQSNEESHVRISSSSNEHAWKEWKAKGKWRKKIVEKKQWEEKLRIQKEKKRSSASARTRLLQLFNRLLLTNQLQIFNLGSLELGRESLKRREPFGSV